MVQMVKIEPATTERERGKTVWKLETEELWTTEKLLKKTAEVEVLPECMLRTGKDDDGMKKMRVVTRRPMTKLKVLEAYNPISPLSDSDGLISLQPPPEEPLPWIKDAQMVYAETRDVNKLVSFYNSVFPTSNRTFFAYTYGPYSLQLCVDEQLYFHICRNPYLEQEGKVEYETGFDSYYFDLDLEQFMAQGVRCGGTQMGEIGPHFKSPSLLLGRFKDTLGLIWNLTAPPMVKTHPFSLKQVVSAFQATFLSFSKHLTAYFYL